MTTVYLLERTDYELIEVYARENTYTIAPFTNEGNAMRFMRNEIRQDAWRRNADGNYAYGEPPVDDYHGYEHAKPTYEIVPMELDKDVYTE